MPLTFLDLPGEIRNMTYSYTLLGRYDRHHGIRVLRPGTARKLNMDLLLTNKTIHEEARAYLFSQNVFDFSQYGLLKMERWLMKIGPGSVQHARINLHVSYYKLHGGLTSTGYRTVRLLRNCCTNLGKVIISPSLVVSLGIGDSERPVRKTLETIERGLRKMHSLEEIIVEVVKDRDLRFGAATNDLVIKETVDFETGMVTAYIVDPFPEP